MDQFSTPGTMVWIFLATVRGSDIEAIVAEPRGLVPLLDAGAAGPIWSPSCGASRPCQFHSSVRRRSELNREEYADQFDLEENYWWFVGRRRIVGALLELIHPTGGSRLRILE